MPILDWLNKEEAVRTAQRVPYRLLAPRGRIDVASPAPARDISPPVP